ncbi:Bifunctional purine biosynthetic protein ADE5,7 [Kalmusia sp. IMI 367209]|nr:Bifunctional purine biosynthetic protein ADE5,7 [Kalmusia sp. IMI 367209]
MAQPQHNLVVLISGNGSNLQALIDACASSTLPNTRITHVISNRKAAYGLERAAKASIPTTYHNLIPYKRKHPQTDAGTAAARTEYDSALASLILALQPRPHVIVCAGWMHILTPDFLNPIADADVKVINLHPALPGEFAGAGAIERAWEAGQKEGLKRTGVMVHEVIAEVDAGEAIVTAEVELRDGESLDDLEGRIHEVEHGLIVEGTRKTLEKIKI